MAETSGTNREYRDRLFKFIFGNPDNKKWTLSLYNALNGSDYTDENEIELNTIEDAVYMSMKNDVSFLMSDTVNFYEQQASFNPNMPMRYFMYAGMVYSKVVVKGRGYNIYSSKLQKAPTPKCICFYNGTADMEDTSILNLSDAFEGESDIEVRVHMININYGHNKELLEACKPLNDYSQFVDLIRTYQQTKKTLEEAIDAALDDLPDDSVIKPFLLANRAEVKLMCITEYDEEKTYADRLEEGIEIGTLDTLTRLVKKGILTLAQAAEDAQMTVAEFEAKTGLTT